MPNTNGTSDNDILTMLGNMADEELEKEERKKADQKSKKRNKKKNRDSAKKTASYEKDFTNTEKNAEKSNFGPTEASEEDIRHQENQKPQIDPELELDFDNEEDPFSVFAEKMTMQKNALSAPDAKRTSSTGREKKPSAAGYSKELKTRNGAKLGEDITKEHAEQLMEEGKRRGHRASIIIRTKVVDREGQNVEPEEIKEHDVPDPEPPQAEPKFILIREETGEAFDISDGATIGRADDNDICIPNPEGHYVSSHHAEVNIQGRDIFLKDLDSTNGTYVNDRKVKSKRIKAGDTIEFADIRFVMEKEEL